MAIVWEHLEITVNEVTRIINESRPTNRNTIQTFLVRMKEKGWVDSRKEGASFAFFPTRPRNESAKGKVASLLDRYFGGSPIEMVNTLLKDQSLTADQAEELRKLIDKAEAVRPRKQR